MRSGWKYTNVYAWCPLHQSTVRLVKVGMLQWIWLRCENCLVKII